MDGLGVQRKPVAVFSAGAVDSPRRMADDAAHTIPIPTSHTGGVLCGLAAEWLFETTFS